MRAMRSVLVSLGDWIDVSIAMGNPQARWMVYNGILEWMIEGYPYFRKPPYLRLWQTHITMAAGCPWL